METQILLQWNSEEVFLFVGVVAGGLEDDREAAHLTPSCNTEALGCCSPSQRSYPWQPASNNGAEPRPQHGRTVAAAKRTGAERRKDGGGRQTGGLEGLEEGNGTQMIRG